MARGEEPQPGKTPLRTAPRTAAQGPRGGSATPSGTPRTAAGRPRTAARLDGNGTRSRLGGGRGSDSLPSSPRGYASRASSMTSESTAANFEELLSAAEDAGRGGDNVKVIVRVRPLSEREAAGGQQQCLAPVGDRSVLLTDPSRPEPFTGTYDRVLGLDATQSDVYQELSAVVENCMAGFNSSIFCYGQTGSGKTYTMQGVLECGEDGQLSEQCGLALRVLRAIFQCISQQEQEKGRDRLRFSVNCSFLEIYNECITDLLRPASTNLNIRDGDLKRGVFVEGLSEANVLNAEDVLAVMQRGAANRTQAETKMNAESSRSHSVFTVTVEAQERTESGLTHVRYSKLNLIDLAGSERVGKSGATGERLTEAQSINKSLTTLGRVIAALVERQKRPSTHVPYRDSRLTFLLQESLGGNSKTCIIANVSPAAASLQETHSTLVFAAGAKKIRNKAVVNEDTQGDMRALQLENARLARLLEEAQRAQRDQRSAEQEEEVAALRSQLAQMEGAVDELRARNAQLETVFDQNNAAIAQMQAEHGAARKELAEARGSVAQLTDECARLRADNQSLSNEVAQLREALDQERAVHEDERAELGRELESATAQLLEAEECSAALRREGLAAASDLLRERKEVAQLRKELEEEREGRQAALLNADARSDELRRAQCEAVDAEKRFAATLARAQQEYDELLESQRQLLAKLQSYKKELNEEIVRNAKYKRMAEEVGRLINNVQNSPRAAGGGRLGALPSPLSSVSGAGSSRRFPLAVSIPEGGGENSPAPSPHGPSPLGNANRASSTSRVSIGSAVALSPAKQQAGAGAQQGQGQPPQVVVGSPAGKSPRRSPAAPR